MCLVYLNGVIAGKFDIHEGSSTKERFLCMENLDVDTVFMQRTIYAKIFPISSSRKRTGEIH